MIGIAVGALAIVLTLILTAIACTAGEDIESSGAPIIPFGWECLCEQQACHWCGWEEDPEGKAKYIAWLSGHGDDVEWAEYHADAFEEYAAEFTALFNSYETRTAKNGATMIRKGNTGSFKFARKS